MELWIRSQDKERLVQVKNFDLFTDEDIEENDEFRIYTYVDENRSYLLGTYKTKERALEVLDEIQEYLRFSKNAEINNKDFLRYLNEVCGQEKCNEILNNISVYEMPKDVN